MDWVNVLASLRAMSLTLTIMSQVTALSIEASKPFGRRRLRLSQATAPVTTHRLEELETLGRIGASDDLDRPLAEPREGVVELVAGVAGHRLGHGAAMGRRLGSR
jgi:hypothetical protein